jgi:inner membrane protein COX18
MTRELYYNEGCHPLKVTILPWIQIPLWITISLALRNMSGAYPGATTSSSLMSSLSNEGILWFPDMTLPDPLFILPFILSAANIINIEMHSLKRKQQGKFQRISTKFFRVLSVGMGVIASQLPSAMTLYWSTSSLYSLIQNSLFMLPSTKRLLKIPITANDSQTPFRDMRKKMKERANEFVKRQRIK